MESSESGVETESEPAVGTGVKDAGNMAFRSASCHNAAAAAVVAAAGVELSGGVNDVGDDVPLQTGAARLEAAGDAGTAGCQDAPGWDKSHTCYES